MESSEDAIIGKTLDGTIVSWNRSAEGLYGYKAAEAVGQPVSILFPPDRQDELRDILAKLRKGERIAHFETVRRRKDGSLVEVSLTISPILNSQGQPAGASSIARDIGERKRTQSKLRQSEEKYRSLVANIPDIVWSADAEGRTVFVSPNIEAVCGYTPEEIYGHVWFERIHPEDAPRIQAAYERLVAAGEVFECEYRMQRKDGRWIWIHAKARTRYEKNGEQYIDGIASDITGRKDALQALEESERKYRSLLTNIPDLAWSAGADGRMAFVSPNVGQIFAFTAEDAYRLGSRVWFESLHPDDAPRVKVAFEGLLKHGHPYDVECRVKGRDGTWIWVHDRSLATHEKDGVLHADGLVTDITERKKAEEGLRESERRYRLLFDRNLAGVLRGSEDGRILECNEAFARILGYESAGQVLRLSTLDLYYAPEERASLLQNLKEHGAITNHEIRFRRSDGDAVWAIANITLVEDESNRARTLEATIVDITDRKRMEQDFIRAKEAAEAASRAKSEFLANMSHEIRTPINGVIGMTELALDTELTAEQRDYLNTAKSSADALLNMVNDVLDFSKIEARKLELECVRFDPRAMVEATMQALGIRAGQKNLELACHIAPDVPVEVAGDPGRLRQILVNLVSNAIKFTERGEVLVRVGKLSQAAGRIVMHFSVSDTGIGIPAEKQQAIYSAFEQADNSFTRRFGGTGLGLAIASQLVGMMDGKIRLESVAGKGTTFYFTVRLQTVGASVGKPSPGMAAGIRPVPVVLVHANDASRGVLVRLLNSWGMKPAPAESGGRALDILRSESVGGNLQPLVIIDAQMPDLDGFELAARIRSDPELACRILLLLGSSDPAGDAARCEALGISSYVFKPVNESELLAAILGAMEPRGPALEAHCVIHPLLHAFLESAHGAGRSARVLVVEDNPVNQRVALRLLEKQGYSARAASNGREALASLANERFDLILMDVQMPEMDGIEATRTIREMERETSAHIPIIAMTAHALQSDRNRCLEAGMDGYVSKPVSARELALAVERALVREPEPVFSGVGEGS